MIDAIIFSKNRACQLDLLLRSIKKNAPDLFQTIHVLYTYTNKSFDNGYEKLIGKCINNQTIWYEQEDFKDDLIYIIKQSNPYVCFFVDDNIFYRKPEIDSDTIDWLFKNVDDFGCFSFRLGLNTTVQTFYLNPPRRIKINHPMAKLTIKDQEVLTWEWDKLPQKGNNFGYPFSVDGHIYPKEIYNYLDYDFHDPNVLEGYFNVKKLPPIMACLPQSCIFNNPINLVGSFNNDAGRWYGHTSESLNQAYLQDKEIDLNICNTDVIGCHQETKINLGRS